MFKSWAADDTVIVFISKPTLDTVMVKGGVCEVNKVKLPSKSVTVPFVLSKTTLAPGTGWPLLSATVPDICVWATIQSDYVVCVQRVI
jgi:hypothetical protein